MINKFFFFLLSFLILCSCGYEPIYSTKNLNFTVGNIEKENTQLNNQFAKAINFLKDKETNNKIDIKIQSSKEIKIKSKDTKGNAMTFELILSLNITILDKKEDQSFSRKITYNNSDDKFGLKQYEKELEKILINNIVEDLINYLSNIQ